MLDLWGIQSNSSLCYIYDYICYSFININGGSLKLVDKFIYHGSNVSSTENDINTRLAKVWTAIDSLLVM